MMSPELRSPLIAIVAKSLQVTIVVVHVMFNICPQCGQYNDERAIDQSGPFVTCDLCGHRQKFVHLPLLIVTGASGSGKSTNLLQLVHAMNECVCLDSDIMWCEEFNKPGDDFKSYRNLWLRMAKNIGQAGRPVVLFGSAVPGQFEQCPERIYFSKIHYLAMTCEKEALLKRLRARPAWRQSGSDEFLQRMVDFNQWLVDNAERTEPPMSRLDTTHLSIEATANATRQWICSKIAV